MEAAKRDEPRTRIKKERPKKWLYLFLLALGILVLLFAGGLLAGYLFFGKGDLKGTGPEGPEGLTGEMGFFKVYYPAKGHLEMEERRVPAQDLSEGTQERARAVMEEFLKGPAGMEPSYIPRNVKVLEVYSGTDRILYVDLSEEFRRNFQGDAVSEFLLLRGIYESILSNVSEIRDVKLLIEGKEVESIGGHILSNLPLGEVVVSRPETKERDGNDSGEGVPDERA